MRLCVPLSLGFDGHCLVTQGAPAPTSLPQAPVDVHLCTSNSVHAPCDQGCSYHTNAYLDVLTIPRFLSRTSAPVHLPASSAQSFLFSPSLPTSLAI